MRLLFSKSASPHHGFAAYYTYLEKIFKADAVLHFGTHGSLEFMPGKQVRAVGGAERADGQGGGGVCPSRGGRNVKGGVKASLVLMCCLRRRLLARAQKRICNCGYKLLKRATCAPGTIFDQHQMHTTHQNETSQVCTSHFLNMISTTAEAPPSLHSKCTSSTPTPHPHPPGQVGMSGTCYPDSLINSIPNLYYYAANNPRCACTGA